MKPTPAELESRMLRTIGRALVAFISRSKFGFSAASNAYALQDECAEIEQLLNALAPSPIRFADLFLASSRYPPPSTGIQMEPSEDAVAASLNDPSAVEDMLKALVTVAARRSSMAAPDGFGAEMLRQMRARGIEVRLTGVAR